MIFQKLIYLGGPVCLERPNINPSHKLTHVMEKFNAVPIFTVVAEDESPIPGSDTDNTNNVTIRIRTECEVLGKKYFGEAQFTCDRKNVSRKIVLVNKSKTKAREAAATAALKDMDEFWNYK